MEIKDLLDIEIICLLVMNLLNSVVRDGNIMKEKGKIRKRRNNKCGGFL
jgi:hypothetical protein